MTPVSHSVFQPLACASKAEEAKLGETNTTWTCDLCQGDFRADSSGQKVDTCLLVRKEKALLDPPALGSRPHQYVSSSMNQQKSFQKVIEWSSETETLAQKKSMTVAGTGPRPLLASLDQSHVLRFLELWMELVCTSFCSLASSQFAALQASSFG